MRHFPKLNYYLRKKPLQAFNSVDGREWMFELTSRRCIEDERFSPVYESAAMDEKQ